VILSSLVLCLALQQGRAISLAEPMEARQEETGSPLRPFAGLEAGGTYALFPDEWGLDQDRDSGWIASFLVGGAHVDGLFDVQLRFSYRHFDDLDIDEAGGVDVDTDAAASVRGGFDVSADRGFGVLHVGGTLGAGAYRIRHRFEKDTAPSLEAGFYVRAKPIPWFYVEVGATAAAVRTNFNDRHHETDFLYTGYGTVGFELLF